MAEGLSLRERFPFVLEIGGYDLTPVLSDSFTFANADPGGHESASFPIPKDLPEIVRGMNVRLICGTQIAWEGRVKEVQRSLGSKTLIQCEGYKNILAEQDVSMVYVDRDLARWGAPSATRAVALAAANKSQYSSSVLPDPTSSVPSVAQVITGNWENPIAPVCEAWYDSGPHNLIGSIYYSLTSNKEGEAGAFDELLYVSNNSEAGETEKTGNLHPSATGTFTPSKHLRFALAQLTFEATPGGKAGAEYGAYWKNLAVYGTHGLTKRGSEPGGFYTSDIINDILTNRIGGTLAAGQVTVASGFVVPHAAYYVPTEALAIVQEMAKLVGYHWGVWEPFTYLTAPSATPRLDFRPYPAAGEPTAWMLREACETVDIREDLSSQYNTVQVTFTDPGGYEGAVEVSVPNPVLQAAGISKRTITLAMPSTSTPAAAEVYGKLQLELLQRQAKVIGSASIVETIQTMDNREMPPWLLKAGIDRLRIPDLPSFDVWGAYNDLPVTRVECRGDEHGITTTVEFGLGPNLIEALNAQLQIATNVAQGR